MRIVIIQFKFLITAVYFVSNAAGGCSFGFELRIIMGVFKIATRLDALNARIVVSQQNIAGVLDLYPVAIIVGADNGMASTAACSYQRKHNQSCKKL